MAPPHANEWTSKSEMMNIAFRLLLTFNATSLLVIIFLVQKGFVLKNIFESKPWLAQLPNAVSYFAYFLVPVLFTGLSILVSSRLGKDEFKKSTVESIEHANNRACK